MISIKKLAAVTISVALATQMCFAASADVTKTPTESKIDSHLKEAIQLKEANEKTPVYIWYEDINYNEVEVQVEKLTGLNKENISVVDDVKSESLFSKLTSSFDIGSVENDIADYMKQTETQRTLEKQNAEKYNSTERKIAKEMYNNKSKKLLSDISLEENSVKFNSNYSPMIIAELTTDEIYEVADNRLIESVSLYEELETINSETDSIDYSNNNDGFPASYYDMELDKVRELFDEDTLSGDGVKIGLIDGYYLFNDLTSMTDSTDPDLPYYYTGYCSGLCSESGGYTGPHYHFECQDGSSSQPKKFYCPINDLGSINYYDDSSKITEVGTTIYPAGKASTHPTHVIDWICGNNNNKVGIAKDVSIYYAGADYSNLFFNMEKMVEANVSVILFERLMGPIYEEYTELERWIDHLVSYHNITVVVPSGNNIPPDDNHSYANVRFASPALANNVITVGACMDTEECEENRLIQFIDGTFNEFYYYYGNGCFKPDLMSPCKDTSTSGAAFTGIIALLHQLRPELKTNPALTKAILMASCTRKADQCMRDSNGNPIIEDGELIFEPTPMSSTSEGTLQTRHGAGIVNVYNAVCITLLRQYGTDTISSGTKEYNISAYGCDDSSISIATTWLRNNSVYSLSENNHYSEPVVINCGDLSNLDLSASINENVVSTSQKTKSTTEMVSCDLNSGMNTISVDISKISGTGNTQFAYAWSTNNQKYASYDDTVGVFRIKSRTNGAYVSMNSAGNISMSSSGFDVNQQWILRNNESTGNVSMQSVYNGAYLDGGVATTNGYSVVGTTTPIEHYKIYGNTNNQITFFLASDDDYGLYTADSTSIEWTPFVFSKFVLERIPYFKGDINLDGEIDNNDCSALLQIIASSQPLSPLLKYVADLDGNNSVNIIDLNILNTKTASEYKYEY